MVIQNFAMLKQSLISLFVAGAIATSSTPALPQTLEWFVQPDSQMDSLPSPDGQFEIEGVATAQDENYFYVTIFAPPELLTGVDYRGIKVYVGDLFFNYKDGSNQAIRLSPSNRSELPYGKLVSNVDRFSVSDRVFGQDSMTEYKNRLNKLGIVPFNTYSDSSLLPEAITSVAKPVDRSLFTDITFIDSAIGTSIQAGMDNVLTVVKIPKTALKQEAGTISLTLECGNDFIEIDMPTIDLVTSQDVIIPIDTEVTPAIDTGVGEMEVATSSSTLGYVAGGATLIGLILLLGGGDDVPPVTNPETPVVIPTEPPTVSEPTDVSEGNSVLALLLLPLLSLKKFKNA